MKIEVLGAGCPKCIAAENNLREALRQTGLEAEVIHVADIKEMAKRGVMFSPAVFVDGEQKIAGRVPKVEEVCEWFAGLTAEKSKLSELHLG
ncbi:MAG: TM0996/MTH895 family glutaredoxin-like protein [Candidatus Tectomicrobia bacterium]|nr:TM0996/MTH895 family glutaredoxin-like protein [Candidatus Tectomicrobia bacterium]